MFAEVGGHGAGLSDSDRARTSVLAKLFDLFAILRSMLREALLTYQQSFQMLDNPLCRFAVPFRRDRAFFPVPCHQSRQCGRQLAGSVPISSFVPIVMVSGRSVLSRRVRHGTPSTVVSSVMPPESVITPRACFTK